VWCADGMLPDSGGSNKTPAQRICSPKSNCRGGDNPTGPRKTGPSRIWKRASGYWRKQRVPLLPISEHELSHSDRPRREARPRACPQRFHCHFAQSLRNRPAEAPAWSAWQVPDERERDKSVCPGLPAASGLVRTEFHSTGSRIAVPRNHCSRVPFSFRGPPTHRVGTPRVFV
jgi:hypothetical protein